MTHLRTFFTECDRSNPWIHRSTSRRSVRSGGARTMSSGPCIVMLCSFRFRFTPPLKRLTNHPRVCGAEGDGDERFGRALADGTLVRSNGNAPPLTVAQSDGVAPGLCVPEKCQHGVENVVPLSRVSGVRLGCTPHNFPGPHEIIAPTFSTVPCRAQRWVRQFHSFTDEEGTGKERKKSRNE